MHFHPRVASYPYTDSTAKASRGSRTFSRSRWVWLGIRDAGQVCSYSTPGNTSMPIEYLCVVSDFSKHYDPLHVLLGYLAEVSIATSIEG
jgi:hypothetical protein